MMCKGHLFCRHTTKSIENFGFRCFFFVAKTLKKVRVKMWVNCLTHIVTHTRKCTERVKEHRREIASFPVRCLPVGLIGSAP